MSDQEKVLSIVALLRQGLTNAEIAKQLYACTKINNAPELINFARLFERHLIRFPKTILRLIHLEKMNNTELIDFLKLLCTAVEE